MDVGSPERSIVPTLDGPVLRVLARTNRPLTGRAVARLVPRASQRGVQLVLDRLVDQGVVLREAAGRAALYTLNRDHLAAPAVAALAQMRSELFRRLRDAMGAWRITPEHASIFGSAARGDGDSASDIDLFVVRPVGVDEDDSVWREQLDQLGRDVHSWTGNHAAIAELSHEDAGRLGTEKPPVVRGLEADGIDLVGTELRNLLEGP